MARGSNAKMAIENKLAVVFGSDYIGNIGGKLYVWADDGDEKVQIALAMTCPKVFVDAPEPVINNKEGLDFSEDKVTPPPAPKKIEAPTQSEMDSIADMLARLNL